MCLICICDIFFSFVDTAVDGTTIPLTVVSLVINGHVPIYFQMAIKSVREHELCKPFFFFFFFFFFFADVSVVGEIYQEFYNCFLTSLMFFFSMNIDISDKTVVFIFIIFLFILFVYYFFPVFFFFFRCPRLCK